MEQEQWIFFIFEKLWKKVVNFAYKTTLFNHEGDGEGGV